MKVFSAHSITFHSFTLLSSIWNPSWNHSRCLLETNHVHASWAYDGALSTPRWRERYLRSSRAHSRSRWRYVVRGKCNGGGGPKVCAPSSVVFQEITVWEVLTCRGRRPMAARTEREIASYVVSTRNHICVFVVFFMYAETFRCVCRCWTRVERLNLC